MKISARLLRHIMNLWPPFLGAGIRVTHLANDFKTAEVVLRLGFTNRNYVGVHFGGEYGVCILIRKAVIGCADHGADGR